MPELFLSATLVKPSLASFQVSLTWEPKYTSQSAQWKIQSWLWFLRIRTRWHVHSLVEFRVQRSATSTWQGLGGRACKNRMVQLGKKGISPNGQEGRNHGVRNGPLAASGFIYSRGELVTAQALFRGPWIPGRLSWTCRHHPWASFLPGPSLTLLPREYS